MADEDEPPDEPQPGPQPAAEILIQPEQMAGVWANVASISQEVVPMSRLGASTLSVPIPAEHLRIHRAIIAKALRAKSG